MTQDIHSLACPFSNAACSPFCILLVRVFQTDLNKLEVCQGRRLNPPLNEKGRSQARSLLTGTTLGAILCSPLRRARETAGIVRERYEDDAFFAADIAVVVVSASILTLTSGNNKCVMDLEPAEFLPKGFASKLICQRPY